MIQSEVERRVGSCSSRNTEVILNVFIRTIFGDWVFCVMSKYHSNKSMQLDRGKESKCKNFIFIEELFSLQLREEGLHMQNFINFVVNFL